MMKIFRFKTIGVVSASALLATLFVATFGVSSSGEYERELLLAELQERGVIATPALLSATPGQLWLLAHYGEEAYFAGRRYPEAAVTLYLLFGGTTEFRSILQYYGYQQVLPVLWYFFHNESLSFAFREKLGQEITALQKRLQGEELPARASTQQPLTPAVRVWIAINRIQTEGNDFLGRFVIDHEGVAHQLVVNRVFAVTKDLLVGNLLALERKHHLGEKITHGDLAWAGVDIALLGLVSTKTLMMLKSGRTAAVAGKGVQVARAARTNRLSTFLSRTAALAPQVYRSSRMIKYGAAGLGVYLLYQHRAAFHAGLGVVADMMGVPRFLFQLLVWTGILVPPLWLLSWMLRPGKWLALPVLRRVVASLERSELSRDRTQQARH